MVSLFRWLSTGSTEYRGVITPTCLTTIPFDTFSHMLCIVGIPPDPVRLHPIIMLPRDTRDVMAVSQMTLKLG